MKQYIPLVAIVAVIIGLGLLGVLGVGLMFYGFATPPPHPAASVLAVQVTTQNPVGGTTKKTAMAAVTPTPANTPIPTIASSPTPVPVMPVYLNVAGVLEAPVEVVKLECPEDGTIEGYKPGMAWCIPAEKAAGYQYQGGDPKTANKIFNGHSSSTRGEYGDVFRPLVDRLGKDLEIKFADGTTQKYKWSASEIFDPGQALKKQPVKDGWVLLVTCACKVTETKQECWQCIGGYNTDGKCPSGQLYPRHRLAVWYVAQ